MAPRGGFTAEDIDELLESLAGDCLGWSSLMAPVIMGNPDRLLQCAADAIAPREVVAAICSFPAAGADGRDRL